MKMGDAIFTVMEPWPLEWHTLDLVKMEKVVAQQREKDTKLCIMKLAERRREEQNTSTQ